MSPAPAPRTTPPPLPKTPPPRAVRSAAVVEAAPAVAKAEPAVAAAAAPAKPAPPRRSIVKRALLGLGLIALVAGGGAWLMDASIDRPDERVAEVAGRAKLAQVKSWGYQLQRLDVEQTAAAPHDLIVVDETLDNAGTNGRTARSLALLKHKPDGGRRVVLSYLSIGEAEDYRRYWQAAWVTTGAEASAQSGLGALAELAASPARAHARDETAGAARQTRTPTASAPAWLGPENAEWRGNYRVRYWMPAWKDQIYGNAEAALDRIIKAGFDGVYLDRADVYGSWKRERQTAKADMIELLAALSAYAHQKKPGFVVVMQNAEELLSDPRVRSALDGVAKEDLLYGVDGEGRSNTPSDVDASLKYLRQAKSDGLPVLVVEYVADQASSAEARRRIESEGFVPYFGPRMLNALADPG